MTDPHFTLDVHPATVRSVARRLKRVLQALDPLPARVLRTPDEIGDEWTGGSAIRVKAEMTTLGEKLTDAEPLLRDARTALTTLAQQYEDALDRLPALNRRWEQAITEHSDSVDSITAAQAKAHKDAADGDEPVDEETTRRINRSASNQLSHAAGTLRSTQRSLNLQFDDLRDDLRRDTRDAAAALYEAMVIKAPTWAKLIAKANLGGQPRAVMWGERAREELGLDLSLVAAHYQARDDAEEWGEALDLHGLPVPSTYDLDRGRELTTELDGVLANLDGLDAAARSQAINEWASNLDPEDLSLLAVLDSARVGNLDGIPNQARYAANRINLADGIESEQAKFDEIWDPPPDPTDDRWAEYQRHLGRIEQLESLLEDAEYEDPTTGQTVRVPHQTLAFVPPTYDGDEVIDDGRLAVVMGDLDQAEFVGTVVPGITNRIDNFDATLSKATNLHQEVPGSATIAWLGYDTPEFADASSTDRAEVGGLALRDFMAGLVRNPDSETTVLAHSYGTLVTSMALQAGMHPDRVVLFGSPGLGENITHKDDLGLPDDIPVYAMRAPGDAVSITAGHGMDPVDMPGIIRLDTDWTGGEDVTGHSDYTLNDSESLQNLAGVLRGLTTTPNDKGEYLVTGGNPLAEDGFAGGYNQNVRDLVDILQEEVPPEVLESFASQLEYEIQNLQEGGQPIAGLDDIDKLIAAISHAQQDSRIGEYLTTDEFQDALIEAGFVDKAATDVGNWVEGHIDEWDGLDDAVIPVPIGPLGPVMVPVPDGVNEWLGDRAGSLSEDAVRGLGEDLVTHVPGLGDLLDTADVVVDGAQTIQRGYDTAVEFAQDANDFREAAQDAVLEGIDTTADTVLEAVRNIDPSDFRLRNPLPFGR